MNIGTNMSVGVSGSRGVSVNMNVVQVQILCMLRNRVWCIPYHGYMNKTAPATANSNCNMFLALIVGDVPGGILKSPQNHL